MRRVLAIIICLACFTASAAARQTAEVTADELYLDDTGSYLYARGNVELVRDGVRLWADRAWYDTKSETVRAFGDVRIAGPYLGSGRGLVYNVRTGEGSLDEGRFTIASDDPLKRKFLWGREITLLGEDSFFIRQGGMSSCEGDRKPWRFEGSDLSVTVGGYLTGRDVTLYASEAPVFHTPWFMAPVKRDRESGLLAPLVGYSGTKGLLLSMPWYQVINDSQDLTFTPTIRTNASVGLDTEYRYILSRREEGEAHVGAVEFFDPHDTALLLNWRHARDDAGTLRVDLNYLEDRRYLTEYATKTELRTTPYFRTEAFYERPSVRDLHGIAVFSSRDTGINADELRWASVTTQRFSTPLATGLVYRHDLSLSTFSRENSPDYQRAVAAPALYWSTLSGGMTWYAEGSARLRAYNDSPGGGEVGTAEILGRPGVAIERNYLVGDGMLAVNSLKTEFLLNGRSAEKPVFTTDADDRTVRSQAFRYEYRLALSDLATGDNAVAARISQSYRLDDDPAGTPRASDVQVGASWTAKPYNLFLGGDYDHERGSFRDSWLSGQYGTTATTFWLTYYRDRDVAESVAAEVKHLLASRLRLLAGARYDIKDGEAREFHGGFEYLQDCYSWKVLYRHLGAPAEEDIILFSINLYGLGELKQSF